MIDIVPKFHEIEAKFFSYSKEGVLLWPLVREEVFNTLYTKVTQTSNLSSSERSLSTRKKIYKVWKIVLNSVIYLFRKKKHVKYLIFNHPRKKKCALGYEDIYTAPILEELHKSDYTVLERLFQLSHFQDTRTSNNIYIDIFDFWPRLISLLFQYRFASGELAPWLKLEKELIIAFGVDIDIKKKIKVEFTRFKLAKSGIGSLLKKTRPDLIIEIVGYNRLIKCVNHVAALHKIPTIELQHGFISQNHIAYNFPVGIDRISTFPANIALWSEHFKQVISLPIRDQHIYISGFKYLESKKKTLQERSKNSILFLSQKTIGSQLAQVALKLADMSDQIVVYKLHPGELLEANVRYKELYQHHNIKVDDKKESDLYEMISEACLAIGVYSTALLEAAFLGVPCIIIKLPGWERFYSSISESGLPFSICDDSLEGVKEILSKQSIQSHTKKINIVSAYNNSFLEIEPERNH